jgi:hypothetical protein
MAELTAYELEREARIARNKRVRCGSALARPRKDKPGLSLDLHSFCSQRKRVHQIMEALGLHSFDLEAVALRNKAEAVVDKKKAKGVKRRAAVDAEPTAPTRRSRRLVRHSAL